MAKTSTQRVADFIARQKKIGRKELRGIYLTDAEEKIIKPHVRAKLKSMRDKQ